MLTILLMIALATSAAWSGESSTPVVVWDTQSRFGDTIDVRHRTGWKAVPTDLLTLEADPAKAFSDPGYYGREYTFVGDTVVENGHLIAAFWSKKGLLAIYPKADPSQKAMEFSLVPTKTGPAAANRCGILRNMGIEAAIEVSSDAGPSIVAFDRTEIIEITPATDIKGIRLRSTIDYGLAPDFIGDDLLIDPGKYAAASALSIPAENLFLGLLKGENRVLVMTWPQGKQQMRLGLSKGEQGTRSIELIEFDCDGQSVYLAVLEAPGIWHKEPLTASFLEKDVAIGWKHPFAARWITQLEESGLRTRFPFREAKGQVWRGVPGMYTYPVWFDGDKTCYRLSKKVMPRGESLIYFLEGQDDPCPVSTPVDVMKATLGRQACDSILDLAGRKLRTHHRRAGEGIRRACTCGCTEAIEAVFKEGQEVEKREYIEGAVGDMVYFITRHMERIDEYRAFADGVAKLLREKANASPELKPFLDSLGQIAEQMQQIYAAEKDNMKSLKYADELARRTNALTSKKDPKNLQTCLDLGKEWRGMGGSQDGVVAQYHMIVRRLFQEAGNGCVEQPAAVEIAREIRDRCRQCLRNPDGYEIWTDY